MNKFFALLVLVPGLALAQGMSKPLSASGGTLLIPTKVCLRDTSTCITWNGSAGYMAFPGDVTGTTATFGTLYGVVGTNSFKFAGQSYDDANARPFRIGNFTALTTDGGHILSLYSDNMSTMRAAFTKDGNLQLGIANAATPTCDAAHRGIIQYIGGGAGVKDKVEVCGKDAANAYAWRVIY
jgi:ABC-type xylose transport system substrate-binding protein